MVRAFVLSVSLAATAFAQQQTPTPPKPADDLPDTPSTTAQIVRDAIPNGPTAVIDTSMGRLTCRFFQKEAPIIAHAIQERWPVRAIFEVTAGDPLIRAET